MTSPRSDLDAPATAAKRDSKPTTSTTYAYGTGYRVLLMRTKQSTRNSPRSKQNELRLGTSQADSGGPGPGDKGHNTPAIYHPSCIGGIEKIGVVKSSQNTIPDSFVEEENPFAVFWPRDPKLDYYSTSFKTSYFNFCNFCKKLLLG